MYCEGNIKQFGKFYQNDNVFEVLGVHMISSISYILDSELKITKVVSKKENSNKIIEVGTLEFETENNIKGIINSSLLTQEKERKINFICEFGNIEFDMLGEKTVKIIRNIETREGYNNEIIFSKKFDESNNLFNALEEFDRHIKKNKCNENITLNVASTLEKIKKSN